MNRWEYHNAENLKINMNCLLDTNILIARENNVIVTSNLQKLLKILNTNGILTLIHPLSLSEVQKDKNEERKRIAISKISSYALLENPPKIREDSTFRTLIPVSQNSHEIIDDNLLYALERDAVEFLITEDQRMYKKAKRLGLENKVFGINEALDYFEKIFSKLNIEHPLALKEVYTYELNSDDHIFDSLKVDYKDDKDFTRWWRKICGEHRKAWVHFVDGEQLGAILILKIENEPIFSDPPLERKKRLKICTLKVASNSNGQKIGELFLKTAIDYALKNNIEEIYFTHFTNQQGDRLEVLTSDYGFNKKAEKQGEDIYTKLLIPPNNVNSPVEIARTFFPSYFDGEIVKKFLVPIRPQYYKRLFEGTEPRQLLLDENNSFVVERNTITKAYICHSKIKKISQGDILLFYRSQDTQAIVSLGTVEKVFTNLTSTEEILGLVGKRTVYSAKEIDTFAKEPTTVILFRHHFYLNPNVNIDALKERGLLSSAPQTIMELSHKKYIIIKEEGNINERFTVH
jgi:hypothetical protein